MTAHGSQALMSVETAVPTLKVMRLQKPDLHMPTAGTLETQGLLGSSMCLPDSFGVIHVGETFTAYLGALNVSRTLHVSRLTVTAQLQTPSQRWHLASSLDGGNDVGGVEVPPESGVDTIVSHALEEAGQHILRVEVGYAGVDGGIRTLRKFYRFQVSNPLLISERTVRAGDSCCYVSISLENNRVETKGGLAICDAAFDPVDELVATKVENGDQQDMAPATSLMDSSGRLEAGECMRYIFKVDTIKNESMKGIAAGDELGKAVFMWRKAGGEMGRIASTSVIAPDFAFLDITNQDSNAVSRTQRTPFLAHVKGMSGLSVDMASAASTRNGQLAMGQPIRGQILPVTVEPIDPPGTAKLGVPFSLKCLIINHSDHEMTLQLQFCMDGMHEMSVCGPSSKNIEPLAGKGGSTTAEMNFVPIEGGLLQIGGCSIMDLNRGVSFPQPIMCRILVEAGPDQ